MMPEASQTWGGERCLEGSNMAKAIRIARWVSCIAFALAATTQLPGAETLEEFLAAGEFGPALKLTESTADSAVRDGELARIAAAQRSAGGTHASLSTIARIRGDRARRAALEDMQASSGPGAAGGVQADFDSLIDLITSTIAPTTWDDVGGNGSIAPFESGVRIDADGVLQRVKPHTSTRLTALLRSERDVPAVSEEGIPPVRAHSQLRKVSLPRLERAIQFRLANGQRPTEAMRLLAGLEEIRFLLVYPETGDIVLAGPAGDWRRNGEGRWVGAGSGRPVLHLDDFMVVWRYLADHPRQTFGCSITPTSEGLARTRAFAEASSGKPLRPDNRDAWLTKLRQQLGRQKIEVFGIDPRTRVAKVLVEADYHMKLIGMGLEDGTLGVRSYLDSISLKPGQTPPPMDVLRWWFTMNYRSMLTTPDRDAFEFRGSGVRVRCEDEKIGRDGEREHTGQASELNQEFAQSFTEQFELLAKKYPVYADMQNLFDLALAVALIQRGGLAERVGWHAIGIRDAERFSVELGPAPREVDTVMHHRVIQDKYVIVGVSGGVRVDPWKLVDPSRAEVDRYGKLVAEHATGKDARIHEVDRWWWD
jgi:hypothetical protein